MHVPSGFRETMVSAIGIATLVSRQGGRRRAYVLIPGLRDTKGCCGYDGSALREDALDAGDFLESADGSRSTDVKSTLRTVRWSRGSCVELSLQLTSKSAMVRQTPSGGAKQLAYRLTPTRRVQPIRSV